MNKMKMLFFTVLSTWTFPVVGQIKYIQTPQGKIVDTTTYASIKAEKVEKMKSIFPAKEVKVTIKDNFKEVRRTPDSLIYSYNWDIEMGDPNAKKDKSSVSEDYLNKQFPLPPLTTLDNEKINIDSLKGKPTLINFWFTTCKPCIDEMPILNAIKDQLKDNVNFIAITFEPTEKTRAFLKKNKFNFTQIANAKKFTESLNMSAFPKNIFLDKNGIVKKIENGLPYIMQGKNKFKMSDGREFIETLRELL